MHEMLQSEKHIMQGVKHGTADDIYLKLGPAAATFL
jgi:hypothetical protein